MFLMVDDNAGGSAGGSSSEENRESPKLQKYGCHPYFNSNMGGCDLQVLFAMSLSTTLPSHDVLPIAIAKGYHKEIKPDAGLLQMEVQHRYDAYGSCINGNAPHLKNWSKMKCLEFLNDFPVTIPQEITFLQNQIAKYEKIQESINNSRKKKMKELSYTIGHLIYHFYSYIIHLLMTAFGHSLLVCFVSRQEKNCDHHGVAYLVDEY